MPAVGAFYRIHREYANGIGHLFVIVTLPGRSVIQILRGILHECLMISCLSFLMILPV
jgi:hypothetical protein